MRYRIFLVVIVCMVLLAVPAFGAEWTPVQLALVHPAQLFPETTPVQGIRINLIYGVNEKVHGLDWGLINRVTRETKGLQLGAFPVVGVNLAKDLQGLQLAGVWGGVNSADGEATGMQILGILGGMNKVHNLRGLQISGIILGVNLAHALKGVQVAGFIGVNVADDLHGVQCAMICNQADTVRGLQLGLVNMCDSMYGVQIGLVNIIKQGQVPVFPIINAQF